jgi:membrane-associated phospholipid phosphatase
MNTVKFLNMQNKLPILFFFIMPLFYSKSYSQVTDSLFTEKDRLLLRPVPSFTNALVKMHETNRQIRSLILPAGLTAYGFIALGNDDLKSLDNSIKEEVWVDHPHKLAHFDDALQYIPGFSVFVLNGLGIQGKNNLLDATRQYFISSFMMMVVVQSLKKITRLKRPDGFGKNAFPSGHTSTAFVAAEFLNQEYKDRSRWYSIAGYAMATAVGYMRIYNNRHWFKDIVTGAGIGIGVTRFVYWIYPSLKRKFFKDRQSNTRLKPYY